MILPKTKDALARIAKQRGAASGLLEQLLQDLSGALGTFGPVILQIIEQGLLHQPAPQPPTPPAS